MECKVMRLADIVPAEYNPRVTLTEADFEYKDSMEHIYLTYKFQFRKITTLRFRKQHRTTLHK